MTESTNSPAMQRAIDHFGEEELRQILIGLLERIQRMKQEKESAG